MDPGVNPVDTFSHTFSSDQYFSELRDFPSTSPSGAAEATSPDSNHSQSQGQKPSSPGRNGSVTSPTSGLNPRSCVTCRKRKVKCDKKQPCSNCQKANIECVFPRPGRAPRRTKKPPDAELLARLRRLEGVVQKLGKGVDGEDLSPEARSPEIVSQNTGSQATSQPEANGTDECEFVAKFRHLDPETRFKKFSSLTLDREMGRLVVGEGRSRYVSNSFWAGLTEEIAEMRDLLDYSSGEEDDGGDHSSPDSNGMDPTQAGRLTHQEFIFGYSSTMKTLRILHPPSAQIMIYWNVFKTNVDPIVRLLHKPTAEQLFLQAAKDQSSLSKSSEALVFAVYMAVITSLSPEECQTLLSIDRDTGLKRYRYATEQALSRAGFLATQELIVVQAFTLFLVCVRRQEDTKAVWTLTGLLLRMAHSTGIHRDGLQFGLPPFDTEMRRRLWWQVCTLDVRASEDQGSEPMVTERFFDTKMPLNINDSDIWPGMTEAPVEHERCTEMTFDLVRYEIGGTIRMLSAMQKCPKQVGQDTLDAKEAVLEQLRLRLEDKYLRHCDMNNPLQWVAANVSRLVMAKIWLVIHHPFGRQAQGIKIPQETRDRTFLTSIDVLRYSRLLETQHKTLKWGWLFKSYFQWHAVAFLLAELCIRTSGPAVEDAWDIIEESWPSWDRMSSSNKSVLWKPIRRLLAKARAIRRKEIDKRAQFPTDGSLGPAFTSEQLTSLPNTSIQPSSFNVGAFVSPIAPQGFETISNQNEIELPDLLAETEQNMYDFDGMGMWADDPMLQNNALLDENMNWNNWDESMAKDFRNEVQQPVQFSMSALWGAG